jgi:hypothetical protein
MNPKPNMMIQYQGQFIRLVEKMNIKSLKGELWWGWLYSPPENGRSIPVFNQRVTRIPEGEMVLTGFEVQLNDTAIMTAPQGGV